MKSKYFCRSCAYRFVPKGEREPKVCPACGSSEIKKDYDANSLLKEVTNEDSF